MLCILYVSAAGFLLGLAGLSIERTLPATAPRRWLWCIIIPVSVFLPGVYRQRHNWALTQLGDPANHAGMQHMPPTSIAPLDPGFWARVESMDPMIVKVWLIASGLLIIWAVINAMRVSHILATARTLNGGSGETTLDGVPVVVSEGAGPATVGVLRSRVVVPQWVLGLPDVQRR